VDGWRDERARLAIGHREERDYMLGPGLLRLAGRAADDSDLARAARPALRALNERSGY
jgi:IclR family transcriptional regulator, acetate operon repressor